jgi:hypothetical protein
MSLILLLARSACLEMSEDLRACGNVELVVE